jgi:hypothetical protein
MVARNRMDALVYGENVTYHPVGDFPIDSSGTPPNEQVRARLRAIINHSHWRGFGFAPATGRGIKSLAPA